MTIKIAHARFIMGTCLAGRQIQTERPLNDRMGPGSMKCYDLGLYPG